MSLNDSKLLSRDCILVFLLYKLCKKSWETSAWWIIIKLQCIKPIMMDFYSSFSDYPINFMKLMFPFPMIGECSNKRFITIQVDCVTCGFIWVTRSNIENDPNIRLRIFLSKTNKQCSIFLLNTRYMHPKVNTYLL